MQELYLLGYNFVWPATINLYFGGICRLHFQGFCEKPAHKYTVWATFRDFNV
jgi:hypothetical protein